MKVRIRTRSRALAVALMLLCVMSACGATLRPGAIDALDSNAFNVLGTWQMSLDALKADCPSGPTSPCPQDKKNAINRIGDAYNVTRAAWLSYRTAVKAGQVGDRQAVSDAISRLILAGDDFRRSFQQ